ncbi:unnamed protein product [Closterium sp. NIES-54]
MTPSSYKPQEQRVASTDLPVLRLHSDTGGEFSSNLLRDFCRGEGILHLFTLPASPQQNGIAERRIGLVMEVAQTLPTLRWTGKVGDASVFRVWGFRIFVRDTSADKLSSRAIPRVFLGFPPDVHGWQFYHPTSRRVLPSQDVTFDESVPFYRLFPCRTAPLRSPPLFLAPGPPPVDPLPPQGPTPSGVSQVDPLPETVPVEFDVDSGAARGTASAGAEPASAEPGGAEPGGAESEDAELGGLEPEGAEPGGAESEGAESRGAEPWGTASSGGPAGASPRLSPQLKPLSPQQLREWFAQRTRLRSGAAGAGGSVAGGNGAGSAGATSLGAAGAGGVGGAGARDPSAGGAGPRGIGAGGTGAGGAGAGGAGAGDLGAGSTGAGCIGIGGAGAGGAGAGDPNAGGARAVDPGAGGAGVGGATLLSPPPCQSQPQLQPDSPQPAPSPYTEQTGSFTERREPESRPASLVRAARTGRRVPCLRPPPVPGTHVMALRPPSVLLRVPLPPPLESSLPVIPDPDTSALVAELVDFAAACRLDYATSLVAESESDCPPSVGGERSLGSDVLEDWQLDFECLAAAVPHLVAMLLAPKRDPDAPGILNPRSYAEAITGTYVDAVPPSGANIVDGMWIFRVKRPTSSPPIFKARYVARGFSQRQGVDFFQTFSPTPKMTTLRVLLHVAALLTSAQLSYMATCTKSDCAAHLASLGCFLQVPSGASGGHSMVSVLQRFGFRYSSPQSTPLPTGHSLSAPPSDESVEPSGPTSGMGLVLGGRGPIVLTGHEDASWVGDLATKRSSLGYTFSLGSGSVSWRSTRSSFVLKSNCDAEIYAGAMAAQELRWLTYLLTDLGERPRSSPMLYVGNKAMIALCQEHRLEHRTKHIAMCYFLARELQHRGQLHLAYLATRANTADIITKAL